jgi:hypothetical protein
VDSPAEKENDIPTTDGTHIRSRNPDKRLFLTVTTGAVELLRQTRTFGVDDDGNPDPVYNQDSISMELSECAVNKYTEFEVNSESFNSGQSSKTDSENLRLVNLSADGEITWHDVKSSEDKRPLFDDGVWDMRPLDFNGVKIQTTERSDTYRNYGTTKVRVTREAVDKVRSNGSRFLVISWREASGGSVDNAGWAKFEPLDAVELVEENS